MCIQRCACFQFSLKHSDHLLRVLQGFSEGAVLRSRGQLAQLVEGGAHASSGHAARRAQSVGNLTGSFRRVQVGSGVAAAARRGRALYALHDVLGPQGLQNGRQARFSVGRELPLACVD